MGKFLHHLEALDADCEPEERWETEMAVRKFLRATTAKLLLEYDRIGKEKGTIGSYVEEFWNEAYLAPDSSVVLNLNPYFLLEESPDPKLVGNQIGRAANLCFASVKMASQLRNEALKPDTFRGNALCMDQFRALFGASRVPKSRSADTIAVHDDSNHVVVMCCNQLYYFQALWPDNGDVAIDEGDLVDILEAICNAATDLHGTGGRDYYAESVSALGVLTSLDRNGWAQAREEMIRHAPVTNQASFAIVDSALFVLVLDDCSPRNKHEAAANMLHGSYRLAKHHRSTSTSTSTTTTNNNNNKKKDGSALHDDAIVEYQVGSCTNRWYDKLQIIVTADGGAGINFEHSAIDGHTALRFVSDIYADTVIAFAQSITKLVHAHQGLVPSVITANVRRAAVTLDQKGRPTLDVFPKKIQFELSDAIQRKIYFAETALGDQILASDTHILEFKDYGKRFITFNKLSPDSYVQMSMMLAYYRLYGKIVCAYEPVLTKAFYHGRTEAMRPATMEAKELCEIFCNPSSSPHEKIAALRRATQAHSQLVKECARGKGVDRHLYALKCIAEKHGLPVPEFFRSEAWRKLNHTILSTSNCGNPSLALFGFGPVVPDGYGIGYIIKDSHLHYAICSKHRQTTRYALTLEGVLREMASLLEPISQTKVHCPKQRPSLKSLPSGRKLSSGSFQDIWGESSLMGSLVDEGKPKVIYESGETRWNNGGQPVADSNFFNSEVTFEGTLLGESYNLMGGSYNNLRGSAAVIVDGSDEDSAVSQDAPVPVKLNDDKSQPCLEGGITPIAANKTSVLDRIRRRAEHVKPQRRGSNDHMPIRPDRRGSLNSYGLAKKDMAELLRCDNLDNSD
eukprot:jgi/Psemu1/248858/estExt_Genewise1.C_28100001